jgi:hypothetical protein
MGLLRKAVHAVPADDTHTSRIATSLAEPKNDRAPVGLLRRTLQALETTTAPQQVRNAAGTDDIARLILRDAKALSDGVELPSLLFTTLRKRLSIAKGALLLYDPVRLEYAPWATFGFDQTTLHRMRIPLGANATFNALANGEPLEVTDPQQKAAFQRFFSSREFSGLKQMILSPYIFEEKLVGALLATEIQHPFSDTTQLLACLRDIAAGIAPLLQKARAFLMQWSQAKATHPPTTPEEQVARLLESPAVQQKKLLFLSLGLGPYVRGIAAAYEDLDLFRLREDLRGLLDAFLADLGTSIMLPAGSLLVCLEGFQRDDIPLFLHQLRHFLGRHFAGGQPGEPAPLIEVMKSRIWPDEGTDARELVSFLSS